MSDISIFTDKSHEPSNQEVEAALGLNYSFWRQISDLTLLAYPEGKAEWNYPGKNYGWSYRIKDKRRAILYFLPRAGFFKVAFIYGDKAVADIVSSDIPEQIKLDLQNARKYAEGRGVSIDIRSDKMIPVVKKLIDFKLAH